MSKLEKFLKNTKPYKSVLHEYKDDIFELKRRGYSAAKICTYLKELNVNVTSRNLNYWLKRQNIQSVKPSTPIKNIYVAPKTIQKKEATDQKDPFEMMSDFFPSDS
ncbi:hypothetical protein Suden_1624 [Sulfurimonas denitrificans DSM 1251]|uniref:Uncharacterized protein n=1 Tax=Sulfurimonas denitrificans (strain ATCC 33889 / DSM 1251) TaxID=326298 RepID=Q30Q30_SULDN|nr:hypothetical protein [Sulfurimonas denitrificans]ABB44901.1 hypothetical protein Suden_1624 [Sulfurimonas denitrificans DSM 1251]